jgi:hypothetical protein
MIETDPITARNPNYTQRHYFLPMMVENSSCRGGLYARLKSGPSGSLGGVEPRPYEMNIYTHAQLIMSSCINRPAPETVKETAKVKGVPNSPLVLLTSHVKM